MMCLNEAQWSVVGYLLYITGSVLYFAQAFGPWYPDLYNDQNFGNMNLAAAYVFIAESLIYMIGWHLGRQKMIEDREEPIPMYKDANLMGNVLFIVGSVGYVFTAHWNADETYPDQQVQLNFAMALLFVIDSFIYLYAIKQGAHSRTAAVTQDFPWYFSSPVDVYLIASIGFVFGSAVYLAAAIDDWIDNFGDGTEDYTDELNIYYMLGAVIFVIDAPLYLLSGFQRRDVKKELPFNKRHNTFIIERIEMSTTAILGNTTDHSSPKPRSLPETPLE
eukprot:TRINITY_DN11814_c0_g1_i1.p1 TRINITY_DN11814_c0_g1~~TRINITY_DN11814_c0_g1_i1.p1  ORF type:complete len:276 (-),score=53.25 TRINITY_DN11814_c0_g1_i1:48-875(-)